MHIARGFVPVVLLLATLAGCGMPNGNGDGSPLPGDGTPATATITAAGGSVEASDAAGATLSLQVPPGAIRGEVDVTLTPRAPRGGVRASYDLEPAGFRFFAPVAVTLTLPAGSDPSGATLLLTQGGAAVPLPTDHDGAARRATATLRYLGYPTVDVASAAVGRPEVEVASGPAANLGLAALECPVLLGMISQQRATANAYYIPSQPGFPEFGTDGIRLAGHATALIAMMLEAERACQGESEANW